MLSTHSSVLIPRKNDFFKESKGNLNKNFSQFVPIKGITVFGGSSLIGPHIKKSKNPDSKKICFMVRHDHKEYFAMEILQLLGVHTPKIRLLEDNIVVSREIDGYIPMICFRHDIEIPAAQKEQVMRFRSLYKIDPTRQVIIELENKKEYKINGETFSANILAMLVRDCDFQPAGFNFGLKKVGNRFYCFAIDKDKVNFDGKKYEDIFKEELFQYCTQDQILIIASRVFQALTFIDKSGQCFFDKIFLNERVLSTSSLNSKCKIYCDNFKKTATSFLEFCFLKFGKNCLIDFTAREKIRFDIATKVVTHLKLDKHWIEIIMNDLRSVYYAEHLSGIDTKPISKKKEKQLLSKLIYDIKLETNYHFSDSASFSAFAFSSAISSSNAGNKRKESEVILEAPPAKRLCNRNSSQ